MTLTEAKKAAREYIVVDGNHSEDEHITELYKALVEDDVEEIGKILDEGSKG